MNTFSTEDIKAAARRAFETRDGELVLKYLMKRFYDCRIRSDDLARQVGRRDVLQHIRDLLREDR